MLDAKIARDTLSRENSTFHGGVHAHKQFWAAEFLSRDLQPNFTSPELLGSFSIVKLRFPQCALSHRSAMNEHSRHQAGVTASI